MTRRVVFAGGIQAKALAKAYRHDVAYERDDDVFFIGTESMARAAAHRVLAAADIVVTGMAETGDGVPDHLIRPGAERVAVPTVLGDFLWPCAGRPHPRNKGTRALPEGPYPATFGDAFLDEMLQAGVSEAEAVSRYLALDLTTEFDLDAALEERLAEQARLDAISGFAIADFVGSEFRRQNLFATADRLRLPLLKYLAGAVFARIGLPAGSESLILEARFPPGAMPIHPSVLRHFGMAAPLPDHRYPVLDEGMFTFEQYCRRYLRYEWNERLHEAMLLAESDPAAAIPALREALEASPGSRAGQLALEEAERAVSDISLLSPLALTASSPWTTAQAQAGTEPERTGTYSPFDDEPAPADLDPPAPDITFTSFNKAGFTENGLLASPNSDGDEPLQAPEPQRYVELPQSFGSREEVPALRVASTPTDRYVPLEPARELIEVLPRMLSAARGLTHAAESPFSAMPETMPPPPLRPVLPPELQSEPVKRGLMGRLFGGRGQQ